MYKAIIIGLLLISMISSGCIDQGVGPTQIPAQDPGEPEPSQTPEQYVNQYVIDDYNKHLATFNDDVARINVIVERLNALLAISMSDDGYYTIEDVNQLVDITNHEYNSIKPHLTGFKEFMASNEQELKNADVDTYQMEKKIDAAEKELDDAKRQLKKWKDVLSEYNKHLDTHIDDGAKCDTIVGRWNIAIEMAAADGYYTAEEVNQLINIANEYIDEYNFAKPHLTSFKDFISSNEQELKDYGVDTYQTKKDIDDTNSIAVQNIEAMISELEYAREYVETSGQEENIDGTIEDLRDIISIIGLFSGIPI